MKFKAKAEGFVGRRIREGEEFDAPDTFKATWAEPVAAEEKQEAAEADADPPKKPRKGAKAQ
jgi:hypothetical protein